jgi:hypothetical protein
VHWNHAVKALAAPMPNVNLKVDQPSASAQEAILVIPTPIASEILALPIPVVPMQFVKTMAMLLSANVLQTMLVIPMFHARKCFCFQNSINNSGKMIKCKFQF